MKEYFRAFKNQDYTHRDYRPYFKAVMCYIEGAWTLGKDFKESFPSDRHYFDTTSWEDLEEKVKQFSCYFETNDAQKITLNSPDTA